MSSPAESVFYTHSAVRSPQSAVHSPQSIFYTDRDDNHLWSRMLSFRIKHSTLFCLHQTLQNISTVCVFLYYEAQKIQKQFEGIYFYDWIGTMKAKSKEETTNTRTKLNSLFSASALLLSVVCCPGSVALHFFTCNSKFKNIIE